MEKRCVFCGYLFTVDPKIPHTIYYMCTEGADVVCPQCMPDQTRQEGEIFEYLVESAYFNATRNMKR